MNVNKEKLNKFWDNYKADFGTESFQKSEAYKWNLFNQMYSIWNWKSDTSNKDMFTKTFQVDGPKNLWQSGNFFPISMLAWMWEKFPIETEDALKLLFDEKIELSERITKFTSILDNKLPELAKLITEKPINQHYHGDLRAISIYLTLQNPSKYFLYKHTIFKDFSKALHLPPVKTGKSSNYLEYVMICNQIRDFIKEDKEFISTYTSYLADNNLYLDPHLHLLVQDFILSTTTQYSAYWVFQGNPTKYDFQNAIKEGTLTDWTASAHRDKFKIGDKVIFWLSGKDAGCYALGEINTEPFENDKQPDGNWKEEDHSEWKVGIQITHNLTSNPIFKEVIDATSEFKDLKVGHQGTNFTATKEEYEGLLDIIDSGKSGPYNKIKRSLSSDKLAVFLQILRAFTKQNNLSEEDPRISFNIRESHSRLVFVIGGRYSLCIEKKKKETILSFISEHDLTNTTDIPFKNKKGEVEAYWNHFNFDKQEEFEKLVFEGLNSELQRNYHCNYKNFSNHEFALDILGETRLKYWLYAPGENANMWEDFHKNGIMGLGWDELGDLTQYSTKEEIATRLKELYEGDTSKANDATANVDFRSSISIGDIVIAKKGRNAYLGYGIVTSDYYFDDTVSHYKHKRNVNWVKNGHWESEHSIALKTLTDITNLPYKPNPSILAHEAILNIMNDTNPEEMNHTPLNQILYGPPGTGKTFSTIDVVVDILEPNNNYTRIQKKAKFDMLVNENRAFFTTFHQSMSYEEFIEGIKPITVKDQIQYEITNGILKDICEICFDDIKELKALNNSESYELSFKEKYREFVKAIEIGIVKLKTRSGIEANLSKVSDAGNMQLKTGTDTREYIISLKRLEKLVIAFPEPNKIKNIYDGIRKVIGGSNSSLYYAALLAFAKFEKEFENSIQTEGKEFELSEITLSKKEIQQLPPYFLIIDEINRGNVSAIFGELITLIEEDKRFGKTNQLFIKLPYSREEFILPPNLHIIGTMNTADRSVEALDTALRRRFSFVEMLPNPQLLNDKGEDNKGNVGLINLSELLSVMNDRIEILVDRDHTIGHAFFMDVKSIKDLKNVFANKIIPLLQEYFYGNYAKMEMVLGPNFFDENKRKISVQFAVQNNNIEVSETNYELKNIQDDNFDLEKALKRLLNTTDSEVEKAN